MANLLCKIVLNEINIKTGGGKNGAMVQCLVLVQTPNQHDKRNRKRARRGEGRNKGRTVTISSVHDKKQSIGIKS